MAAVLIVGVSCGAEHHPLRVYVRAESGPGWLFAPDAESRTIEAAETIAAQWGGVGLADVTISWVAQVPSCGSSGAAMGCTVGDDIFLVPWGATCPEGTRLPHEIGHVAGLRDHSDPRWCSREFWEGMAAALSRLTPDDADCQSAIRIKTDIETASAYCP